MTWVRAQNCQREERLGQQSVPRRGPNATGAPDGWEEANEAASKTWSCSRFATALHL